MERIVYRITLDAHKNGIQRTLQGFETGNNMSRQIAITLAASGDSYDLPLDHVVAMMYVMTSSATEPSINNCVIDGNTILYDVLPTDIAEEGMVEMQLKLVNTRLDGARSVLVSPRFALEVTESNVSDEGAEKTTTFTALEDAIARANEVYNSRVTRVEIAVDGMFLVHYADGNVYENDFFKRVLYEGNVLLAESYAHGGTGVRTGEDSDNAFYYSQVSKSASADASKISEESRGLLEEARLKTAFTVFDVNFDNGTLDYMSANYDFDVNEETGDLEVDGGDNYKPNQVVSEVLEEHFKKTEDAIAVEKAERKAEVAVERARIDSFTALAEGSTTGDAELIDGRIDHEGNTHTNIGGHIRSVASQLSDEIGDVKSDLIEVTNVEKLSYTLGGYIYNGVEVGSVVDLTPVTNSTYSYCICDCVSGDIFTLKASQGTKPRRWAFVDENNVLLSVASETEAFTDLIITAPSNTAKAIFNADIAKPYYCNKGVNRIDETQKDVEKLKATQKYVALRNGLNIDTINHKIEIPNQRIVVNNTQVDITDNVIEYDQSVSLLLLLFNLTTKTFKVIYSAQTEIENDDYIVMVSATDCFEKSFVCGYFTVNEKEPNAKKLEKELVTNEFTGLENTINDWWIYPVALRHNGARDKIYLGYVDNEGNQGVISYNKKNGAIDRKRLRSGDLADEHNCPSVNVLDDGRVLVVLAGHGSTDFNHVYVSKRKESLHEFEEEKLLPVPNGYCGVTYSQVFKCGGKWWMFYRLMTTDDGGNVNGYFWAYRTSDDGVTWGDSTVFLSGNGVQYYCIARPYDDNTIKLYMQSNAYLEATEIRFAFIDCSTMNLVNLNRTKTFANLTTLTEPLIYTSFETVIESGSDYLRLFSVGEGEDLSFCYARSNDATYSGYKTYYCRYDVNNGFVVHQMPTQGVGFGLGYNTANGLEIVERDVFIMSINHSDYWTISKYHFDTDSNTFVFDDDLDTSVSEDAKLLRPFKCVNDNYVVHQRGRYRDYLDFDTDLELNEY